MEVRANGAIRQRLHRGCASRALGRVGREPAWPAGGRLGVLLRGLLELGLRLHLKQAAERATGHGKISQGVCCFCWLGPRKSGFR